MKKLVLLAVFCGSALFAQAQSSQNMQLLGSWASSQPDRDYNDIWGYAANGREYAIMGSNWGTHFIDVTDPAAPVEVASFAGTRQVPFGDMSWRDYKTYGHYAYAVADGFGLNLLQIFDLSGLPNTVTKVYEQGNISTGAHTITQENDRLYLVANRTNSGTSHGIDIVSLANPTDPVLLGSISSPTYNSMHAIHVRNDTIYGSVGFNGFYVFDATNPANPTVVNSITNYPSSGYNHSSWTSGDRKTIIFSDEVPSGLPVKVFDISDIHNPVLKSTFSTGTMATPHNTFIIGNNAILSYYMDGVQVWDLADPVNPVRIGYYDTYPDNDSTFTGYNEPSPYEGAWGVYPFLPSGNLLVSDMKYGLKIITPPYTVNAADKPVAEQQIAVYPNPTSGQFSVRLPEATRSYRIGLYNMLGQQVQTNGGSLAGNVATFQTGGLATGLYTVQIIADGKTYSRKLTIQ